MNTPTILVPLDGSKFAECALPFAIGMADRLGAAIELVCIVPDTYPGWRRRTETAPEKELNRADSEGRAKLEYSPSPVPSPPTHPHAPTPNRVFYQCSIVPLFLPILNFVIRLFGCSAVQLFLSLLPSS